MGISPVQIAFILVLGVLIFGKNLPDVARRIGLGLTELKKGLNEFKEISKEGTSRSSAVSVSDEISEPTPEEDRQRSLGRKFEPPEALR